MNEKAIGYLINIFVVIAVIALPSGLVMQYLYPTSSWWLLSVGALILFMAG